MPVAKTDTDLDAFCKHEIARGGWWGESRKYIVSMLKAWYGDAATDRTNDYCFRHLPQLTGDHSHFTSVVNMIDRAVQGYFIMGENPVVGSPHAGMQREGLRNLEWLVVRDMVMIESAEFWKDKPETTATEVFFFPAAAYTEKSGSVTNTHRLVQWHHKAIEAPGETHGVILHFVYHLGKRLEEDVCGVGRETKDRPIQDLTWDVFDRGRCCRSRARRKF